VVVPPVKIDFDKPTPTKIAIDYLPDAKNIKVEILGAKENGFTNAKLLPGSEFVPGETSSVVWVGEKENDTPLGIKVDAKPSVKGIDISYTARMKLSNTSNEEAPFIKAKFVKERKKIIDALPATENMKKTVLDNANKEKDAKKKDEQVKKIEADYKLQIQDPVDHLNNINKMYEDIHQKATLHFRVVMDAGAGLDKIVLAQSEGAPVPEPPKKK
jgi:hypothetical protein